MHTRRTKSLAAILQVVKTKSLPGILHSKGTIINQMKTLMDIEYRNIPGYPGYQVDSNGFVWSCIRRKKGGVRGETELTNHWKILKRCPNDAGYYVVYLCNSRGRKLWKVNRLVLFAFTGENPLHMMAAHENNIPTDNRFDNLSWKTPKQNTNDRHTHGTMTQGEEVNTCKVTEEIVLEIRERRRNGESIKILSQDYGLQPAAISKICLRINWKHI